MLIYQQSSHEHTRPSATYASLQTLSRTVPASLLPEPEVGLAQQLKNTHVSWPWRHVFAVARLYAMADQAGGLVCDHNCVTNNTGTCSVLS